MPVETSLRVARRLSVKIPRGLPGGNGYQEHEHPRDRKGRWIEKGGRVRVWGGRIARVIANIGGGRIEIENESDRSRSIVHRNYLDVVSDPQGNAPKVGRDNVGAALPEVAPSAEAVDEPERQGPSVRNVEQVEIDAVNAAVESIRADLDDEDIITAVDAAALAFSEALRVGTDDEEAQARDLMADALDAAGRTADIERVLGAADSLDDVPMSLRATANSRDSDADGNPDVDAVIEPTLGPDDTPINDDLITRTRREGGATLSPRTGEYAASGFAVAVRGHSLIIPADDWEDDEIAARNLAEYLREKASLLDSNPNLHVGTWYDRDNGEVVLDLSEVHADRNTALALAQERNEQAIFDLDNLEEIDAGGTGDREVYLGESAGVPGDGPSPEADQRDDGRGTPGLEPRDGAGVQGEAPGEAPAVTLDDLPGDLRDVSDEDLDALAAEADARLNPRGANGYPSLTVATRKPLARAARRVEEERERRAEGARREARYAADREAVRPRPLVADPDNPVLAQRERNTQILGEAPAAGPAPLTREGITEAITEIDDTVRGLPSLTGIVGSDQAADDRAQALFRESRRPHSLGEVGPQGVYDHFTGLRATAAAVADGLGGNQNERIAKQDVDSLVEDIDTFLARMDATKRPQATAAPQGEAPAGGDDPAMAAAGVLTGSRLTWETRGDMLVIGGDTLNHRGVYRPAGLDWQPHPDGGTVPKTGAPRKAWQFTGTPEERAEVIRSLAGNVGATPTAGSQTGPAPATPPVATPDATPAVPADPSDVAQADDGKFVGADIYWRTVNGVTFLDGRDAYTYREHMNRDGAQFRFTPHPEGIKYVRGKNAGQVKKVWATTEGPVDRAARIRDFAERARLGIEGEDAPATPDAATLPDGTSVPDDGLAPDAWRPTAEDRENADDWTRKLPSEANSPTPEQAEILRAAQTGENVVVRALAGTGKTSTVVMLARRMLISDPSRKMGYVAFNKAIKVEASQRLPQNGQARTANSLAWSHVGRAMTDRWSEQNNKSTTLRTHDKVAAWLGLPKDDEESNDIAKAALDAVGEYMISADDEITAQHLSKAGLDDTPENLAMANRVWDDYRSPKGNLFIAQDVFVKLWGLSRPDLSKGGKGAFQNKPQVIIVDEAQDLNPVLSKILREQTAQVIQVGDSNQAIYAFRGAVDELKEVEAPHDLPLTVSWRFGENVQDIANRFLQMHGSKERVTGGGSDLPVLTDTAMVNPDAIINRGNGGNMVAIAEQLALGRKVGVPSGTKADLGVIADTVAWMRDGARKPSKVDDTLSAYPNWRALEKAVESGKDARAKTFLNMVNKAGGVEGMRRMVQQVTERNADTGAWDDGDPDVVITTAHKAKGLEFERVQIGPDFRGPEQNDESGEWTMPEPEELRLAYVAVTRAEKELDAGSLAYVYDWTEPNGAGEQPAEMRGETPDADGADAPDADVPDAADDVVEPVETPAGVESVGTPDAVEPVATPDATPEQITDATTDPNAPATQSGREVPTWVGDELAVGRSITPERMAQATDAEILTIWEMGSDPAPYIDRYRINDSLNSRDLVEDAVGNNRDLARQEYARRSDIPAMPEAQVGRQSTADRNAWVRGVDVRIGEDVRSSPVSRILGPDGRDIPTDLIDGLPGGDRDGDDDTDLDGLGNNGGGNGLPNGSGLPTIPDGTEDPAPTGTTPPVGPTGGTSRTGGSDSGNVPSFDLSNLPDDLTLLSDEDLERLAIDSTRAVRDARRSMVTADLVQARAIEDRLITEQVRREIAAEGEYGAGTGVGDGSEGSPVVEAPTLDTLPDDLSTLSDADSLRFIQEANDRVRALQRRGTPEEVDRARGIQVRLNQDSARRAAERDAATPAPVPTPRPDPVPTGRFADEPISIEDAQYGDFVYDEFGEQFRINEAFRRQDGGLVINASRITPRALQRSEEQFVYAPNETPDIGRNQDPGLYGDYGGPALVDDPALPPVSAAVPETTPDVAPDAPVEQITETQTSSGRTEYTITGPNGSATLRPGFNGSWNVIDSSGRPQGFEEIDPNDPTAEVAAWEYVGEVTGADVSARIAAVGATPDAPEAVTGDVTPDVPETPAVPDVPASGVAPRPEGFDATRARLRALGGNVFAVDRVEDRVGGQYTVQRENGRWTLTDSQGRTIGDTRSRPDMEADLASLVARDDGVSGGTTPAAVTPTPTPDVTPDPVPDVTPDVPDTPDVPERYVTDEQRERLDLFASVSGDEPSTRGLTPDPARNPATYLRDIVYGNGPLPDDLSDDDVTDLQQALVRALPTESLDPDESSIDLDSVLLIDADLGEWAGRNGLPHTPLSGQVAKVERMQTTGLVNAVRKGDGFRASSDDIFQGLIARHILNRQGRDLEGDPLIGSPADLRDPVGTDQFASLIGQRVHFNGDLTNGRSQPTTGILRQDADGEFYVDTTPGDPDSDGDLYLGREIENIGAGLHPSGDGMGDMSESDLTDSELAERVESYRQAVQDLWDRDIRDGREYSTAMDQYRSAVDSLEERGGAFVGDDASPADDTIPFDVETVVDPVSMTNREIREEITEATRRGDSARQAELTAEIARRDEEGASLTIREIRPSNAKPGDVIITQDGAERSAGTATGRAVDGGAEVALPGGDLTIVTPNGRGMVTSVRGVDDSLVVEDETVPPPAPTQRRRSPAPVRATTPPAHARGSKTARPTMYTYQRQNLVALGLDDDPNQDATVKRAAERVRARQALDAEENAALGAALRTVAQNDTSLPIRRRRSLERLAYRFDAAAAKAEGRPAPVMPNQTVARARPADIGVDDQIALPVPGGFITGKVVSRRSLMRGRLVEVVVEDPASGERMEGLVTGDTDLYLLPDLPDPIPEVPEGVAEVVDGYQVRPGDTLRIWGREGLQEATVSEVREVNDGYEMVSEVEFVEPGIRPKRVSSGAFIRTARGPQSAEQPFTGIGVSTTDVDTDVSETVPSTDIRVGDRVSMQGRPYTVIEISEPDPQGQFVIDGLDAAGTRRQMMRSVDPEAGSGETVRFTSSTPDVTDAIIAGVAARDRDRRVREVTERIDRFQEKAWETMLNGRATDWDDPAQARQALESIPVYAADIESEVKPSVFGKGVVAEILRGLNGQRTKTVDESVSAAARQALTALTRRMTDTINASTTDDMTLEERRTAVEAMRANPPRFNTGSIARTLDATIRDAITSGALEDVADPAGDLVTPEPTGSLEERVAGFKAAIGGRFGQNTASVATFGEIDLVALENGETPAISRVNGVLREDIATDGGPGEIAMHHLTVVKAAGREVFAEVERETIAAFAGEGIDFNEGESVTDRIKRANDERTAARAQRATLMAAEDERYHDAKAAAVAAAGIDEPRMAERQRLFNATPQGQAFQAVTEAHRAEIERIRDEALERVLAAERMARTLRTNVGRARRDATIRVLGRLRPVGNSRPFEFIGAATSEDGKELPGAGKPIKGREQRMAHLTHANEVYPTSWYNHLRDAIGGNQIRVRHGDRAHAQRGTWIIQTGRSMDTFDSSTATHEMGHFMEYAVPGLVAAERAFMWERTSTGEIGDRERENLLPGPAGYEGEKRREDQFPNDYSGKDYGSDVGGDYEAYELFTTTVQSLFHGEDEYADEEMRAWALGVLATLGDDDTTDPGPDGPDTVTVDVDAPPAGAPPILGEAPTTTPVDASTASDTEFADFIESADLGALDAVLADVMERRADIRDDPSLARDRGESMRLFMRTGDLNFARAELGATENPTLRPAPKGAAPDPEPVETPVSTRTAPSPGPATTGADEPEVEVNPAREFDDLDDTALTTEQLRLIDRIMDDGDESPETMGRYDAVSEALNRRVARVNALEPADLWLENDRLEAAYGRLRGDQDSPAFQAVNARLEGVQRRIRDGRLRRDGTAADQPAAATPRPAGDPGGDPTVTPDTVFPEGVEGTKFADPTWVDAAGNLDADAEERIVQMFSYRDSTSGLGTGDMSVAVTSADEDGMEITTKGAIYDANGLVVGEVSRTVTLRPDGRVTVNHDLLQLQPRVQGGGFADAYYKALFARYEASEDVTDVTINANIDVGGYAWAQRGFDWYDGETIDSAYGESAPYDELMVKVRDLLEARRDAGEIDGLYTQDAYEEAMEEQYGDGWERDPDYLDSEDYTYDPDNAWSDYVEAEFESLLSGGDSPYDIANYGRNNPDLQWEKTLESGRTVPMWLGKAVLLGMHWDGIYRMENYESKMDYNQDTFASMGDSQVLARRVEVIDELADEYGVSPATLRAVMGDMDFDEDGELDPEARERLDEEFAEQREAFAAAYSDFGGVRGSALVATAKSYAEQGVTLARLLEGVRQVSGEMQFWREDNPESIKMTPDGMRALKAFLGL